MPLTEIAIEQIDRRIAPDRRCQLPAEVHRVAEPEVEPLAAQRRVDMRGVAREHDLALAVGGRLVGAIRPGRGKLERGQGDVCAGHTTQDSLHMLERERPGAVKGAAVELDHGDRARP